MPEPCPWCSGQKIDPRPVHVWPGSIQCDCTGLCGYDWCPAAARYVEAREQALRRRVAALREGRSA